MASPVYFATIQNKKPEENNLTKISALFKAAGLNNCITDGALTAIKLHFGEPGNDTYIKPTFVRQVVDDVKACGGKPYLTDTNTMYIGGRHEAVSHLHAAHRHGFVPYVVDAPVIIADGLTGNCYQDVAIKGKHFNKVKIADGIVSADSMIVMSHVKAHAMCGFGGALKNLSMGCAPPLGKRDQHQGMQATVDEDECVGCGICIENCPFGAISATGKDKKAFVDKSICYGCSACLQVCPNQAVNFDWDNGVPLFVERMTEYAAGAVAGKEKKVGYINFVMSVTPDCDCVPWSDAPVVPDIGFLASTDPVAVDTAAMHLINQQKGLPGTRLHNHCGVGEDKFSGLYEKMDPTYQFKYAEKLGLGSMDFELIEI